MMSDDIEESGAASADDRGGELYRATACAVPAPVEPESAEAKRALACAITGLFCLGFLLGPLALSLGKSARFRIAEEPGTRGVELANAAIVLGKVALAVHLALMLVLLGGLFFALPPSAYAVR